MTSVTPMPAATASRATWAAWYAARGLPVFPTRGKIPRIKGGHGYKDATTDAFQIHLWWQDYPDADIGAATGGAFWALDVDPRHDGDATLQALEAQHDTLPLTAHTLSGRGDGGGHYLFQVPAGGMRHKADLGEGLDVLATGGLIVLPPSVHPATGQPYHWDLGADLDSPGIASTPGWLAALVAPGAAAASGPVSLDRGEAIPAGQRDNTLAAMAIRMRHAGFDYSAIRVALDATNARCEPPVAAADLDRIATSATRYEVYPTLQVGGRQAPEGVAWDATGAPPDVAVTDLTEIMGRTYPPPQWLVKGLIPEGLTFIAGSPKSSKTYLAYSLALSLAYDAISGKPWLGHYPLEMYGPVIYLSLEDDEADTYWKVHELLGGRTLSAGRFYFFNGETLPSFEQGLVPAVAQLFAQLHPSLLVIDPISYLYSGSTKTEQFQAVRQQLLPLRWLGKTHHCCVMALEHRRKKSTEDLDIVETMYGSNAKAAVADAMLMLVREQEDIQVHVRMRRGPEQTLNLALVFDESAGRAVWQWKGSSDGIVSHGTYGDMRQRVLTLMMHQRQPWSVGEILLELELPDSKVVRDQIRQLLYRSHRDGELEKTTRGKYVFAEPA